jgi:hypothetical protein
MKKLLAWLRDYHQWINQYCIDVAVQRDRDLAQYHIWKGIVK